MGLQVGGFKWGIAPPGFGAFFFLFSVWPAFQREASRSGNINFNSWQTATSVVVEDLLPFYGGNYSAAYEINFFDEAVGTAYGYPFYPNSNSGYGGAFWAAGSTAPLFVGHYPWATASSYVAEGINDGGLVVGRFYGGAWMEWPDGSTALLPTFSGWTAAEAHSVHHTEEWVVGYGKNSSGVYRALRWDISGAQLGNGQDMGNLGLGSDPGIPQLWLRHQCPQ